MSTKGGGIKVAQTGMFEGLPQKKIAISGSQKCIVVDPGDGFAMNNGESKILIGGSRPTPPTPTLPLDRH